MTHNSNLIRLLHNATRQRIDAALESMELTSAQGLIMGFLLGHPDGLCSRDIEQEFHLSHATVSGLLARMEKKGLIAQETDAADRRCKRILALPKAAACGEQIRGTILSIEAQMMGDFSEEEKQIFIALLSRAARNMGIASTCGNENKEENQC